MTITMTRRRLGREHKVFTFSRKHPPVMEVEPGETVLVETTDSFDDQFDKSKLGKWDVGTSEHDTIIDLERALPHTGPIAVRGAQPGDTLVAELINILPVSNAFISCLPGFSRLLLGEKIPEEQRWTVRIAETLPGRIRFNEDIYVPYRLMVGSLGVAPAQGEIPTAAPGNHGGNHDCYLYTIGSKLYLPVQVPGALVTLGDVHGAMGDGEGAGTAIELDAEVTVRFDLVKGTGRRIDFPVLETGTHWMVYGSAVSTDDSLASAKDNAIGLLSMLLNLDFADCYMLISTACDIRINELVNPTRSARVEIPKTLLRSVFHNGVS